MIKGLIGGASGGGQLNDEDWAIPFPNDFVPYSNTISGVDNDIKYWIADIGYDFWRSPSYKVAPFIGYSEFRQDMKGLGCAQIANPFSDCSTPIPRSTASRRTTNGARSGWARRSRWSSPKGLRSRARPPICHM